ncbi:MAG: exosome complex RNA-binding protein Rrp4 [archaeon]|nr:exosome complex RNA-binding protein Rrp4 [archaeon]
MTKDENERKIVIPGEVVASGEDYLPGEWTEKKGKDIIALKYGLAEETKNLVRIIPLSGVYEPRRGNIVIGEVENLTFNGWIINIGASKNTFLPVSEFFSRYINKNDLSESLAIKDLVAVKIFQVKRSGIDLTTQARGLGKLEDGMIIKINPNKVPRVIGREGSMVSLIKEETNCNITVGQNGLIWLKGNTIEEELLAKKAILFIVEKSFISGLTEEIKEWFNKEKKGK